jgi:hypothetical protein
MATFEFNNTAAQAQETRVASAALDPKRLREECIIAFKVYDACRQPDCKALHFDNRQFCGHIFFN